MINKISFIKYKRISSERHVQLTHSNFVFQIVRHEELSIHLIISEVINIFKIFLDFVLKEKKKLYQCQYIVCILHFVHNKKYIFQGINFSVDSTLHTGK